MGTIAYLYLDESGSFGTQDRVAVVAGYRSALDEAQAGAFVRASMADSAREAGIDPAMVGHLTELRASARGDTELRARIEVYLDLLWKRWSMRPARMIPVCIIYRHKKEIVDSDSLYLDMLAELCSIQILLDPEVESWVFLPALRVRERFHGKVVRGEDPCFPKEEYAAVLTQKIRDALIPLGRGGAGFEIRPRSARTMEFLMAADYISNRSYHDWIVRRNPGSEGDPELLPAGAGEFHFATLGLMENVLVSLENAQWDNALISLLRAGAALGGGSAAPESLFPQVWERIQAEFLEDDAPLDSIPGFAESLAEASCKSGRRLGYGAGVAAVTRLLDLHPDRLEAAAARFMLAVTGAELALRGADGRGLREFLGSAEALENAADEHPACVDAAIRFVLLRSLCALERADPDLSRCLAQDALAMVEAQAAAAALVPGMGSDPRSRLLPAVLRIRAVVESRAAFLAGDGPGAAKAVDMAIAALEVAATPLERCLAQADARLAILRARICGAGVDTRITTVFDTDVEVPRGKDDSAFLALCAAAWAGRLWALMQSGAVGTPVRACPACERLAAIRETAPVTDFERLLAFAMPGADAATAAGADLSRESATSTSVQKRIADSLGLPAHIASLSGAVSAAANVLGRTDDPRWLALGLLAGPARPGSAVPASRASGESVRAPAGFAKLTHALEPELRLRLSALLAAPGPGFGLALLDLCSAGWEMPG